MYVYIYIHTHTYTHITLQTKVHIVKAMVFPVVMYGSENWTIKKFEHQRIDAFELWCWPQEAKLGLVGQYGRY